MRKNIPLFLFLLITFCSIQGFSQTAAWTSLLSGTSNSLLGVSSPSLNIVYVCGTGGLIMKSSDAGSSWTTQASGTGEDLYSMWFTDVNTGYAVGNNGACLHTTNGGANWNIMSGISSSLSYRYVWFYDSNNGYITGGVSTSASILYKTTDGGTSWNAVTTGAGSTSYGVYFTSPLIGFETEYTGAIHYTLNGGSTWTSLSSGSTGALMRIWFPSSTVGIACDQSGAIRRSTDGGATWTGVLSGTSDVLTGLMFYDANHGFMVGGNVSANTGMILSTVDGGASWSSYLPSTSRLFGLHFYNANLGYAVGVNGTILKYTSNVGIEEFASSIKDLDVFPNPAHENCQLDCGSLKFQAHPQAIVYNTLGEKVSCGIHLSGSIFTFDINGFSKGTYLIQIIDGEKVVAKSKMIVD